MVQSLTQVGTSMYEQAGAARRRHERQRRRARTARPAPKDEETVDAEFREVGGEERV